MTNEWNWNMFFKQAATAAFVLGAGYAGHRVRENQMDDLLAMSFEDALRVVIESVPQMNNDTWLDFQQRLANRINTNRKAAKLLEMSRLMVASENEIRDVISRYNTMEAHTILVGMLHAKTELEQFATVAFLRYMAQTDPQARAIMGYLIAS